MVDNENGRGVQLDELISALSAEGTSSLITHDEQTRTAAVHYIASSTKAEGLFPDDKMLASTLDQSNRTLFESREEMFAWLDLCDWSREFDLEEAKLYCLQYISAVPSLSGLSRNQLVAAVTSVQHTFGGLPSNKAEKKAKGGGDGFR